MKSVKLSASLPQPAFGAKQVQQNEAQVAAGQHIEMYELMESAGTAVYAHINARYQSKTLLVMCGKGNNGGDGYVIARLAQESGYQVTVLVLANKQNIQGDAATALSLLLQTKARVKFTESQPEQLSVIENYHGDVIVDCIFGIGFKGSLSEQLQIFINAVNQHSADKISVDVPSGLDAETGVITDTCVRAKATITFIVFKKGLLTGKAANAVGELYLADLALGQAFIDQQHSSVFLQGETNKPQLKKRKRATHKGNIGLGIVVGGNQSMPGAARLTSEAALRAGAALIATACHQDNRMAMMNGRPEIMLAPSDVKLLKQWLLIKNAKAYAIGPGLGVDDWAIEHFNHIIELEKPCVVDADALNLLAKQKLTRDNWILTPHPKEAANLLACSVAEVEQNRFEAVTSIAQQYGGICLLKGAGTLISDGAQTWINTSGNPGMASGGMGDVLTGIILAMIMQCDDLMSATRLAAFIHGQAADIIASKFGERGMLASDLFVEIRSLVNIDA